VQSAVRWRASRPGCRWWTVSGASCE